MGEQRDSLKAARALCRIVLAIAMLAVAGGNATAQGAVGEADFCNAESYDNFTPQLQGLFTDLRNGRGIRAVHNVPDVLPDAESCPLKFTGVAGAAGDMWITLLGRPGPGNVPPTFQCVFAAAWITIHRFDNRKGVGFVMNYDPTSGRGLFWAVYDSGNSDVLSLSTFDATRGALTGIVGSLPLQSKIKENVRYALIVQLCNTGVALDTFAFVTDFQTVSEGLLLFGAPLPIGIAPEGGQIGLAAHAKSAFVDSTVEAFFWEGFLTRDP